MAGVDAQISIEADAAGKPLKYFETALEQLSFFADLPQEVELELLTSHD